jgi:hypothetical protein
MFVECLWSQMRLVPNDVKPAADRERIDMQGVSIPRGLTGD